MHAISVITGKSLPAFSNLLLGLSLGAGAAAQQQGREAKHDLAGRWTLVMDREGWSPKVCRGVLVLEKKSDKWKGSLRFDIILNAQQHAIAEVETSGDEVRFRLDPKSFDLRFSGKLGADGLSGECDWKDVGRFPFTATKDDGKPPARFDTKLPRTKFFPKGDAEKLGMDGAALDELLLAASRCDTDALLILKDGRVVCEQYFGGAKDAVQLMSVTKFLTAMAAAMLLEEGAIESLDDPVSTWFPEWGEGDKAEVTLRHLLTHTSGIEFRQSAELLNREEDKVEFVRGTKMVAKPGSRIAYSNEAVAMLSGILADAADQSVDEYLSKKLFKPLEIQGWHWDRDGAGNTITYAQLVMSARDLAKVGQFVLDGEKHGRETLLSQEWIDRLATPGSSLSKEFGLLWQLFLGPGGEQVGFGHTGWLGQYLVVMPKWKLVGVRLRHYKDEIGAADAGKSFGAFAELLRKCVQE